MPRFFQALSKSTLYPKLWGKPKIILGHARPYFSRARNNAQADNHENFFSFNLDSLKIPLNEESDHLWKGLYSSRFLGGAEGDHQFKIGIKNYHADKELPKWKQIKDHVKDLEQIYQPQKKPKDKGIYFMKRNKISDKNVVKINDIKKPKIRIKPKNKLPIHSPKPLRTNLSESLGHLLKELLSRYVFTKKQVKKVKKSPNKPRKIYKKGIIDMPKIIKKSMNTHKKARKDKDNKLEELWSPAEDSLNLPTEDRESKFPKRKLKLLTKSLRTQELTQKKKESELIELGELRSPNYPKRLTKSMRLKMLKTIFQRGLLKKKMAKRVSKHKIKSLHTQKLTKSEKEGLMELWPTLVDLGELKGPRNPKRLCKSMRARILKTLPRTALNLQNQYKEILRNKFAKRKFIKSLHTHKLTQYEKENKLMKLWTNLVDQGEIKGPKDPKRLTKSIRHKLLNTIGRNAIKLPTEYIDILKHKVPKRQSQCDSICSELPSARATRSTIRDTRKSSLNFKLPFSLGKGLKIHDYGFKKANKLDLKRDSSKSKSALKDLPKSITPREAEVISSRKLFRTMDLKVRGTTRQTAFNMFLNINKFNERTITSKSDLLDQMNRMESLNKKENDNIEDIEEPFSPVAYDLSESLNRAFPTLKRRIISRTHLVDSVPEAEDRPGEFWSYTDYDYEKLQISLHRRKRKTVKTLMKKKHGSSKQSDAATQTETICPICNSLQKYKTEKVSPLVMEMEIRRNFLTRRQYYMDNLKHRKFLVIGDSGNQKTNFESSNKNNLGHVQHSNQCFSMANYDCSNTYLKGPKIITETYENLRAPLLFDTKSEKVKAYKALDMSNIFLKCYQTLFEAEQRTNNYNIWTLK